MVLFKPAQGNSASGAVDQDGSFTLMTKRPGDGVQPGDYKVVLQFWKSNANKQLAVPKKYCSASTTPLTATVDAEHTTFYFKVEK